MTGIMKESLLQWTWNGAAQEPFLYSEGEEEALLRGFLVTMGGTDATSVPSVVRDGNVWKVETAGDPLRRADPAARLETLEPPDPEYRARIGELERLCNLAMIREPQYAGLHTAVLSDGMRTVTARDVGRHNALDKAVGEALAAGMDLKRTALCSSGRISLEMFAKAACAGIPVLATRKQAGSLAVAYGEKLGIAVCRLGEETECFCAGWRVIRGERES